MRRPACLKLTVISKRTRLSQQLAAAASDPMSVQGQGMVPEWRPARMLAASLHLPLGYFLLANGHVSAHATATCLGALPPPTRGPPSDTPCAPQPLQRLVAGGRHHCALWVARCARTALGLGGRARGWRGASAAKTGGVARPLCLASEPLAHAARSTLKALAERVPWAGALQAPWLQC